MALTWHEIPATHGSVTLDNVLLFASRAPLPAAVIDGTRRRRVELARVFPAGLGYVHIVDHHRVYPEPDKDTQQALLDLIRHTAAQTRASMVILGGVELGPVSAQVMASTVKVVAHVAASIRIYRTLEEGAGWFGETLREGGAATPDLAELVEVGEELVRRVRASPAPSSG